MRLLVVPLLLLLLSAPACAQEPFTLYVVTNRTSLPVLFSTQPHADQTAIPPNATATHATSCERGTQVCWGARSDAQAWGFTDTFCIPCGSSDRFELTDYGWQR